MLQTNEGRTIVKQLRNLAKLSLTSKRLHCPQGLCQKGDKLFPPLHRCIYGVHAASVSASFSSGFGSRTTGWLMLGSAPGGPGYSPNTC